MINLIYLASPYSHPDEYIRRERYEHALRCTAFIMSNGVAVFSPIVHSHPIAERYSLPNSWDFWEMYDTRLLEASDQIWVLTIDGWKESVGVQAEIKIAKKKNIIVRYLQAKSLANTYCYQLIESSKSE